MEDLELLSRAMLEEGDPTLVSRCVALVEGLREVVGGDLVEDARRGVLVGATSAGPTGGEVLGLLALAVHAEVPTAHLRRMIFAYPTFHRGVEDALRHLAH